MSIKQESSTQRTSMCWLENFHVKLCYLRPEGFLHQFNQSHVSSQRNCGTNPVLFIFLILKMYMALCRVHTAWFFIMWSPLFSHCVTICGSIQSLLCSLLHDVSASGGYTPHDFTYRSRIRLVCRLQSKRTREVKEINA